MKRIVNEMELELNDCAETKEVQEFTIKTKDGTKYLNSVRELYYSLLSIGITPDKMNSIVHLVLSKNCAHL